MCKHTNVLCLLWLSLLLFKDALEWKQEIRKWPRFRDQFGDFLERERPAAGSESKKLECFTKTLDYTFDANYISWKVISNGDTNPSQIKATVALFQIWHQVCCVRTEDADMHALKMIEYLLIRELNSYSSSDDKEWKQSAFKNQNLER